MKNLHGVVAGAVSAINEQVVASYQESNGYTTDATGRQIPQYRSTQLILAQVQALAWKDLQMLDGINMNGDRRAMFLYGHVEGVLRPKAKGGDLITIGCDVWLVAQNLEQWVDWCKVAVTLQNGS